MIQRAKKKLFYQSLSYFFFVKFCIRKKGKTDGNIHVSHENWFERIKFLKILKFFTFAKKLMSLKNIFPNALLDTKKLPYFNIMEKLCESRV